MLFPCSINLRFITISRKHVFTVEETMKRKKNNVHARRMSKGRNIPWSINFYLSEQWTMNLKHEGNKLVAERYDERNCIDSTCHNVGNRDSVSWLRRFLRSCKRCRPKSPYKSMIQRRSSFLRVFSDALGSVPLKIGRTVGTLEWKSRGK